MSDSNATVFLIDDDPSIRRAMARLLAASGYHVEPFETAGAFLDGRSSTCGPACIVLDLQMPGINGLDLQHELLERGSGVPIVFITGHGDVPSSVRAMKSGAVDFLPKPVEESELLRAIKDALMRDAVQRDFRAEREELQVRLNTLTPREREVMTLVAEGLLNKQIAARLGTVEKTIKVHRGRVMQKMQFESLAELVRVLERHHASFTP